MLNKSSWTNFHIGHCFWTQIGSCFSIGQPYYYSRFNLTISCAVTQKRGRFCTVKTICLPNNAFFCCFIRFKAMRVNHFPTEAETGPPDKNEQNLEFCLKYTSCLVYFQDKVWSLMAVDACQPDMAVFDASVILYSFR